MNIRDKFVMWRPRNVKQTRVQDKSEANLESSSMEEISSSTSSESSVETSDDEMTIEQIRRGSNFEENEEFLLENPRPNKIQKLNNVEMIQGSQQFPSPFVHFDTDIQRINHEIRQLKKKSRDRSSSSSESSDSSSSSSDSEQKKQK